ncbi:class I glutamine amidotransferase-like protein [Dothidotthia symphoricarpi CBS 119687]|uniref:Class I glutamine amidotransferase-like protein n=1 Tax=Dothidotthia symphoricarpi CBS 119687 TaxID=1392245 RepID=A0A6A6A173_9PLEO|nr:class I glutamine amidotransferase-like protein [Dothidotthia symphoricarpi CBS 119687]KAF2124311.1 class I glutamine amidotransferase-like protein [Dothidotthia symphoricarpi CBS 119687]
MSPTSTPTKFGIILFPGFQLLDATGPLDALNLLATSHPLTLSIIAETLTPVSTRTDPQTMVGSVFAQSIVPTHTFSTAPRDLEVLILPGGLGTRDGSAMEAVVEFLRGYGIAKWGKGADKGKWVVTVCTGSEVLARTGVLDGKRATTNKRGFNGVR